MSRARYRTFLLLGLLIVAGGCKDNTTRPSSNVDLTPEFQLTAVNGRLIPTGDGFTSTVNGVTQVDSVQFVAGSMNFRADDTYQLALSTRHRTFVGGTLTSDQSSTVMFTGTWLLLGTSVSYTLVDNGTTHLLEGDVIDREVTIQPDVVRTPSLAMNPVLSHALKFAW